MKGKFLLIAGAVLLGLYYIPTALGIIALDYRFDRLELIKVQADYIRLGFDMFLTNNKNTPLTFQGVDIQLFLNGQYVANINNPYSQTITPNASTAFQITADIGTKALGSTIWQAILNQQVENYQLDISGTVTVNNKKYPVKALFTAADVKQAFS